MLAAGQNPCALPARPALSGTVPSLPSLPWGAPPDPALLDALLLAPEIAEGDELLLWAEQLGYAAEAEQASPFATSPEDRSAGVIPSESRFFGFADDPARQGRERIRLHGGSTDGRSGLFRTPLRAISGGRGAAGGDGAGGGAGDGPGGTPSGSEMARRARRLLGSSSYAERVAGIMLLSRALRTGELSVGEQMRSGKALFRRILLVDNADESVILDGAFRELLLLLPRQHHAPLSDAVIRGFVEALPPERLVDLFANLRRFTFDSESQVARVPLLQFAHAMQQRLLDPSADVGGTTVRDLFVASVRALGEGRPAWNGARLRQLIGVGLIGEGTRPAVMGAHPGLMQLRLFHRALQVVEAYGMLADRFEPMDVERGVERIAEALQHEEVPAAPLMQALNALFAHLPKRAQDAFAYDWGERYLMGERRPYGDLYFAILPHLSPAILQREGALLRGQIEDASTEEERAQALMDMGDLASILSPEALRAERGTLVRRAFSRDVPIASRVALMEAAFGFLEEEESAEDSEIIIAMERFLDQEQISVRGLSLYERMMAQIPNEVRLRRAFEWRTRMMRAEREGDRSRVRYAFGLYTRILEHLPLDDLQAEADRFDPGTELGAVVLRRIARIFFERSLARRGGAAGAISVEELERLAQGVLLITRLDERLREGSVWTLQLGAALFGLFSELHPLDRWELGLLDRP